MTKEQFDLKYRGKKVAVHCDTEEKAETFLKLAKSFGYKWLSGVDLDSDSRWRTYENDTCYSLNSGNEMLYDEFGYYWKNNYKIVEFELDEPNGYAIEDTPSPFKETFKVGDEVYDNLSGRKCKIEVLAYLVKFDKGGLSFRKISELSHNKPLTKITKEQLADMGYEVEE